MTVEDVYNSIKRYNSAKTKFLSMDHIKVENRRIKINLKNKELAVDWLEHYEEQLKHTNGYDKKAEIRNSKTLYKQLYLLKNALYWFNDIDLDKVTKEDIKRVFEGLEKGIIRSVSGKNIKTKQDYYTKVFKGRVTLFGFLKKNALAQDVIIRKYTESEEVRYFDFDTFRVIVDNSKLSTHKLAFWLLYDTAIEVNALVQLRKSDFTKEYDPDTKQDYYRVRVRKEISKKSRQKRYLDIYYPEANTLLDTHFSNLKDDDKLFNFNPPALHKALKLIVRNHNLKTKGDTAQEIALKDFRSSCATNLLRLGFSTDYIKARLGHKPSSTSIDRYVNYLGLKQEKPRREIEKLNIKQLQKQINELQITNKRLMADIKSLEYKTEEFWQDTYNLFMLVDQPDFKKKLAKFKVHYLAFESTHLSGKGEKIPVSQEL